MGFTSLTQVSESCSVRGRSLLLGCAIPYFTRSQSPNGFSFDAVKDGIFPYVKPDFGRGRFRGRRRRVGNLRNALEGIRGGAVSHVIVISAEAVAAAGTLFCTLPSAFF